MTRDISIADREAWALAGGTEDPTPRDLAPKTLVIYHKDCVDGFTAAWVCWLKFGDSAEYIPAKYGDVPPDCTGLDVYIVDFSYPRAVIEVMAGDAKSLTIFDHHKTAQADLADLKNLTGRIPPKMHIVFDMERSGAGITWDELHGESGNERPWFVDYVEDRDLWRFRLPSSREVNEWLSIQEKTFERWNEILPWGMAPIALYGGVLLQSQARYIEMMRAHAQIGHLMLVGEDGANIFPAIDDVPIVNAPPHVISDLLGALAQGHEFAVGWFQRGDGMYQYSLRSRGDGGADVSAIAKAFGGGGHRGAAGFVSKERVDVWGDR